METWITESKRMEEMQRGSEEQRIQSWTSSDEFSGCDVEKEVVTERSGKDVS